MLHRNTHEERRATMVLSQMIRRRRRAKIRPAPESSDRSLLGEVESGIIPCATYFLAITAAFYSSVRILQRHDMPTPPQGCRSALLIPIRCANGRPRKRDVIQDHKEDRGRAVRSVWVGGGTVCGHRVSAVHHLLDTELLLNYSRYDHHRTFRQQTSCLKGIRNISVRSR